MINIKIKPIQYNVNIQHFVFSKCRFVPDSNPFITYFPLEMAPTSLNLGFTIYIRLNMLVAIEGGLVRSTLQQKSCVSLFRKKGQLLSHIYSEGGMHLMGRGEF